MKLERGLDHLIENQLTPIPCFEHEPGEQVKAYKYNCANSFKRLHNINKVPN